MHYPKHYFSSRVRVQALSIVLVAMVVIGVASPERASAALATDAGVASAAATVAATVKSAEAATQTAIQGASTTEQTDDEEKAAEIKLRDRILSALSRSR